jgi:hypothetical protein
MEDDMDPAQTVRDAAAHLQAGELAEAQASLEVYWNWRRAGGFEPVGGDALARWLRRQLDRRQGRNEAGPVPLGDCLDELEAIRRMSSTEPEKGRESS